MTALTDYLSDPMKYSSNALLAGQLFSRIIIPHAEFQSAIDYIENAIQLGNNAGIFAGVRITAPSGSGKSLLLQHISESLKRGHNSESHIPVIAASLKEGPTVSQIQNELLRNFNYGLSTSKGANNNEVNTILVTAIEQHDVQLIALDEFQHIFQYTSEKYASTVIDWLKRLMNMTRVPVALSGTELMERLATVDPQLTTRIPTVLRLSPFKLSRDWLGFLLALSNESKDIDISIIHKQLPKETFAATEGSPRLLKSLLVQAIVLLVDQGVTVLTPSVLKESFRLQHGPTSDGENPFAVL